MSGKQGRYLRAEAWRLDPVLMMRDAGFDPDPHQIELLRHPARNIQVMWSRQGGKSQTLATLVLHQCCFDQGQVMIMAGEKQSQAGDIAINAFQMHERLSEIGELPSCDKKDSDLYFGNKSRVRAVPSERESVRGPAVKLAVIDEAAFTPNSTLAKLAPMLLTTRGRLVAASTPNGAAGWWADKWRDASDTWSLNNPDGWWRTLVDADRLVEISSRITREAMDNLRKKLTPMEWRQECMLEFLDGQNQFFPTEVIRAARKTDIVPLFDRLREAAAA